MPKKVAVIGAGFAGLSAACHLARDGYEVTVIEKNDQAGGRARKFESDGFTFDMGPSWYWMPDVFESFFNDFGKTTSDFYELVRLDPSYRVFFSEEDTVDIPATEEKLYELFDSLEAGSSKNLKQFLKEAGYKYKVGIQDLVYKPGRSLSELMDLRLISGVFRLHVFSSMHSYVRKYFSHPYLIQLLEFPVLFLGAMPKKTPALYSLMNYADMALGTWYPMGGMHKIIQAMKEIAESLGVKILTGKAVEGFEFSGRSISGVRMNGDVLPINTVVNGADYRHVEQELIPQELRNYSSEYWEKRSMAPSSIIYYLGVNKKLDGLLHHNLFFDTDFELHSSEIYEDPKWPTNPLFYVCCPSKTDPEVAPEGQENLFILIPTAPGLTDDSEEVREKYYDMVMERIEKRTGQQVREHVTYKRSYAHSNFISDYNAFKGNAYGLANTLRQTANLKPSIASKKIKNLYFTGQLTVPGPGVPPSLVSGKVVAREVAKHS